MNSSLSAIKLEEEKGKGKGVVGISAIVFHFVN